jgi:hypothetical protein
MEVSHLGLVHRTLGGDIEKEWDSEMSEILKWKWKEWVLEMQGFLESGDFEMEMLSRESMNIIV